MTGPRNFDAPWGTPLKLMTGLATAVLLGTSALLWAVPPMPLALRLLLAGVNLSILAGTALFAIRGYEIGDHDLFVLRPGWRSRVSLEGLQTAAFDPEATQGSVRICGNGGLFAFCGWCASRRLRRFRLFGTDLKRSVVLTFPDRRVVVTPDEPQAFVRKLKEIAQLA